MTRRFQILVGVITCLLGLAAVDQARAARHALLIGVGKYAERSVPALEGPAHDLRALHRTLTGQWGIPRQNVTVLKDGQATRRNIIAELNRLQTSTRPGDFIFIYFSGHGTSFHDKTFKFLDAQTGALIPYDFKVGPVSVMRDRLLIGNRDIRPILTRLDRDRKILAVFDSCYSGNTVRSFKPMGVPRYFIPSRALDDLTDDDETTEVEWDQATAKSDPYPYRNVVYISAASKREVAQDISSWLISSGQRKTIDGRPHGALTDSLLRGLSGAANTNRDQTLTMGELYRFVRRDVSAKFSHTPQVLYAANNQGVLETPALGVAQVPLPPPPPPPPPPGAGQGLRVSLGGGAQELQGYLSGRPGITLVDRRYDLLVTKHGGKYLISLANGFNLASLPTSQPEKVAGLIQRRAKLRDLVRLRYPGQDFNVNLDLLGKGGVLTQGDPVGFRVQTEARAFILMMNIDPNGYISILYPYEPHELAPLPAGRPVDLEIGEVRGPGFGTEYIKIFAFKRKPVGFDRLKGGEFWPSDRRFNQLLRMVRPGPGKAQATLTVKTASKTDLSK